MGRSVNKMTLVGKLGGDPEKRVMPNGDSVVNLSIATDESYNDRQTGQRIEDTEWHRVVAYGKLADTICQYLRKGSNVYLEGKLKTRQWEKDGSKRYTTEILVKDMVMLDRPSQSAGGLQQQNPYNQPQQSHYVPNYSQQPAQGYQTPTVNNGFPAQQQPQGNNGW